MRCSRKCCLKASSYTIDSIYLIVGALFINIGSKRIWRQASRNLLHLIIQNFSYTFSPQMTKDVRGDGHKFSESAEFVYMTNLIILITGIFSALSGSLGILGKGMNSKGIMCTSAVFYTIIFLTKASSFIFICVKYHKNIVKDDFQMTVSFVWIITSIVGAVLNIELGGVPCQCNQQDASHDLS